MEQVQKRTVGRPPIPFDLKIGKLNLNVPNGLIRRFEMSAPSHELAYTRFAELVIERGLEALEHDQTANFPIDGTQVDHAITYSQLSE